MDYNVSLPHAIAILDRFRQGEGEVAALAGLDPDTAKLAGLAAVSFEPAVRLDLASSPALGAAEEGLVLAGRGELAGLEADAAERWRWMASRGRTRASSSPRWASRGAPSRKSAPRSPMAAASKRSTVVVLGTVEEGLVLARSRRWRPPRSARRPRGARPGRIQGVE